MHGRGKLAVRIYDDSGLIMREFGIEIRENPEEKTEMKEIFTATMKESHTECSALLQSATVENREFGGKEIRKN